MPLTPLAAVAMAARVRAGEITAVGGREPADAPPRPVQHDATTGVWTLEVEVPTRGWTTVDLRV